MAPKQKKNGIRSTLNLTLNYVKSALRKYVKHDFTVRFIRSAVRKLNNVLWRSV